MKSVLWQPLKPGDIVDVVAPGFRTTDEKLQGGIEFLRGLGLEPRVPDDIFGPDVVCAQTDETRLRHLKKAFQARDSKAVWCIRAGYGAIRIIDGFSKLKKPKTNKLFIGYSDAVTIHGFLNQFWGFASIHGPLLDRLGDGSLPPEMAREVVDVVFGRQGQVKFENLEPLNAAANKKKKIRGRVIGGNLKVVEGHIGTRFSRAPHGEILFFEDIGERGYRVDRMLKHLQMADYIKGASAIVLGDFINGNEPSGESVVPRVLERFAGEMKIPVFRGMESGHGSRQRPVPLYTNAELQCGGTGALTMASGFSSSGRR